MPVSKPFVIATEGPTVDGRNISRQWISDMAANYDPKVYTAVANLEHFLSMQPDSIWSAYGKVVSLSTQETEIMGEKKLQLLAVVDVSKELSDMQKAGKKAFASAEVMGNFIGKGIAYLTGLAFTDTPASIGTESMKFSMGGTPGERYASASEVEIEFEADKPETPNGAGESLFSKVKELLGVGKKDADARFADQSKAIEAIAISQKEALDSLDKFSKSLESKIDETAALLKETQEKLAAFKSQMDNAPDGTTQRPKSTGSDGRITTDC